jgi:membrane-associated phospholipid phosphatase
LVAVALPFLLNRHWKLGAILACLALLGGVARVFVGVHWPVDILGGVVVGTVGGIIGWKVTEKGGRWLFQLWGLEQKVLKTIREGGQW